MPDFLLEIGCEEIPARMIDAASQELRARVAALLSRERLAAGEITGFDTPRRLTVMASGISASQSDVTETVNGPSVNVAYKDGQPTAAAHAFAKKSGVDVSQLEKITTSKGEYLSAKVTRKGRSAVEILAESLPREMSSIYWPKNMYWRKAGERFVRPVRWLVAMLDGDTIPLEFDGVWAGKTSRGHRLLSQGAVTIPRAGSAYIDALRAAKVLGRAEREQQIRKALDAATRTIPGARWREDKSLLDTVVNLTEFSSVILGGFDPQFLALPEEVLVTVMRDHQKYFAMEDVAGKLLPHFLAVLNTDGDHDGLIRHGNERVLRARFSDARFFWETDQRRSLLERLDLLRHVTFQKDLGSYYEKTRRVQRLCSWLSEIIKQSGMAIRPGVIHKAAALAKTDLTSELVKEFTELQGIVGGLYARAQELDSSLPEATRFAIADAIYDHYKPESTEDDVPRSLEGAVLSVGDKADTVAGMFALGLVPSGSKDPFALRRQANGIVKVIDKYKLPLKLSRLVADSLEMYAGSEAEKKFVKPMRWWRDNLRVQRLTSEMWMQAIKEDPQSESHRSPLTFLWDRLRFYMCDVKGYKADVANAVLAADSDDVVDALARAEAVKQVLHMPEVLAIGAACKRMRNILRQATEKGIEPAEKFEYMPESAHEEKLLMAYMERTGARVEAHRSKKEYVDALLLLSTAREPLDKFFEKVMVMVEDERVRANRLALLRTLLREFSTIADFSEIVTDRLLEVDRRF
ncbi:MAG TPA: glycine--tRNA ligase subunit beta [Candidatus Acidoferrum sp.]|jgi:glycyl-tRNA synthetase beta chain|nr:glycine--tRNA ligase subunit beta [Candidatus Acidoferrum sp.]